MTKPSPIEQIIDMLVQKAAEEREAGVQQPRWQRWVLPAAVAVATVAALAKPAMTIVGAFAGSGSAGDGYTSTCAGCGETFDEDDLDEGGYCEDCADDSPNYCCGIMYENGETVCRSCGDPL